VSGQPWGAPESPFCPDDFWLNHAAGADFWGMWGKPSQESPGNSLTCELWTGDCPNCPRIAIYGLVEPKKSGQKSGH
jgi:hypothetical protein